MSFRAAAFYGIRNQMHYNNELDENILKTLIKRNILPTNPDKR